MSLLASESEHAVELLSADLQMNVFYARHCFLHSVVSIPPMTLVLYPIIALLTRSKKSILFDASLQDLFEATNLG